jgi:hypothetical protein
MAMKAFASKAPATNCYRLKRQTNLQRHLPTLAEDYAAFFQVFNVFTEN